MAVEKYIHTYTTKKDKKLQIYLTSNRYMAVEKYIHTYTTKKDSNHYCKEKYEKYAYILFSYLA
jgi:hypothetical protein